MARAEIFFVLLGLLNGERGVLAQECGPPPPAGRVMPDGWYYLEEDGDPDGEGPFSSRDEAEEMALKRNHVLADSSSPDMRSPELVSFSPPGAPQHDDHCGIHWRGRDRWIREMRGLSWIHLWDQEDPREDCWVDLSDVRWDEYYAAWEAMQDAAFPGWR